ncbi:uncharacterized protein LOC131429181 [Malaya genurostris]|uniref:uncharacterized protein LOC131429181 n=1 Tax=Malaya genurostris TaxID=325434 RepID=UPI0026F3E3CD|nr:uncharacterized protein LOC131429181 [Malaya genurostris]
MEVYKIDIAVLQEVNANAQKISTKNYEWNIAVESQNKSRGLAVLIKKNSDIRLKGLQQYGKAILSAKIQTTENQELIIINVHGPNKGAGSFFNRLGQLIDKDFIRENAIILGDWNAQIGIGSLTAEDSTVIGKELGFEKDNENGEEFKMFLHIHKMNNISSRIGVNTKVTWWRGQNKSQIDHVVKATQGAVCFRFIKGFKTKLNTDHKLIVTEIVVNKPKEMIRAKKGTKRMNESQLENEGIRRRYHKALEQHTIQSIPSDSSIDQAYNLVSRKMKEAANEALRNAYTPLTPKRRLALNRLKYALKLANKFPDMKVHQWKLKDRKQEYQRAVKEHKEASIKEFYRTLNDFNVNVRIQKSYKFLKQFMRDKKNRKVYIPMREWNEALKESTGPEIMIHKDHDTCPLSEPPNKECMNIILQKSCNGKSAGADGLRMEHIKYANEQTREEMIKIWENMWSGMKCQERCQDRFKSRSRRIANPKAWTIFGGSVYVMLDTNRMQNG